MIADLHPDLVLRDRTVEARALVDLDVECPQGLLFVPTPFITDRPQCTTSEHWPATIY